jgi:serine/threonine protein kinase
MFVIGVGNRQPANFKALYPNATDEGIDLLRQLLVLDPEQRISASTALKHNFINEFVIKLDDDDNDCMMKSDVEKFDFGFESEVNKLKKAFAFFVYQNSIL